MAQEKKKISKARLRAIIVAAISFVVALALIITNFFVPVKYLGSYMVSRNKRAEVGVMRVRFVDVGYGDCTIVELPDGKNMLIDAGYGKSTDQARILKFLNKSGINTIDYLICTNVNAEHCGGLYEILKFKTVNKIYMPFCENTFVTSEYRNFATKATSDGIETAISEYGAGEEGEDYFFKFLSPSAHTNPYGEYAIFNANPTSVSAKNNASAVIWLEYAGTSFLLTSDAGDEVLQLICASYELLKEDYPARLEDLNVIKVAGHGAETSSYAPLYELTKPEIAVISVGSNGYGCPSLEAISNAVNYAGDNLYRTDEHGTVTVEVTKDGYEVVK